VKYQQKNNRGLIASALIHTIFPGPITDGERERARTALQQNTAALHFLILFRDEQLQYRGLYVWDKSSDFIRRIGLFLMILP
jgi:hypothetical protein